MNGKLNQGLKTGTCLNVYDAKVAEISGTFQNGSFKVAMNKLFCIVIYYYFPKIFQK